MSAIVTVRYYDTTDGGYWGEFGNWTGIASDLQELRQFAVEALEINMGVPYVSRAYFEVTSGNVEARPRATEEFWPAEMTGKGQA